MNELTFRRDDRDSDITLKRGSREVTFKKVPDAFAVRLKQGRATDEAALESSLGRPQTAVRHVDSDIQERLDTFRLEAAVRLEETMDTLRQAPNADVVTHLYTIDTTPGAEVIPTGSLTIQFEPGIGKTDREEILAEFGLEVVEDLDFLPDGYTVRLTGASTENPLKIAAKLQQRAEIVVAEPDLSVPVSFEHIPDDSLYPDQWHLNNKGDLVGLTAGADVKAEAAWEVTRGTRDIKICVMDDGFDLGHPDFDAPHKIVAPRDFRQDDLDPNPGSWSDNHGTACAGVALAEENGTGVVGLASECAFMPMRMANISDNAIVDYFQYAIDNGADVISCSWSARPWNFPLSTKMSGIIQKAARQGRNGKGCVILFAAGNQDRPLDGEKDGQISHQGFALHPDVLAVAASNSLDRRSSYSNFGPELAICAPSNGSPGRGVVTTDRRGFWGYSFGDYTFSFGGTSSSTPLAAGLAALILSVDPELTSAKVREIMQETADKIDEENGQYVDGHSPWYGHGRINAHRAVQQAKPPEDEVIPPDDDTTPPDGDVPPADDDGPPPDDDVSPPDNDEVELILEILDVQLHVIEPSFATPQKMILAETRFAISGADAEAVAADEIGYRNDVQIENLANGETTIVASGEGQLQPDQFEYTRQEMFPIPDLGRYELQSIISLLAPSGEVSVLGRGPTFKVIP